jgi:hypothetical protein
MMVNNEAVQQSGMVSNAPRGIDNQEGAGSHVAPQEILGADPLGAHGLGQRLGRLRSQQPG